MLGLWVVLTWVSAVLGLAVGACSSPPQAQFGRDTAEEQGFLPAQAAERYFFDDLGSLVATSDVVAYGSVARAVPGPMVGEEPGRLQLREVVFQIEEVLHGVPTSETVTIYELGWGSSGQPLAVNHAKPSATSERAIVFLQVAVGAPTDGAYVYINSQGRVLHDRGDQLRPGNTDDELNRGLAQRGLEQLREDIASASAAAARGDVRPVEFP